MPVAIRRASNLPVSLLLLTANLVVSGFRSSHYRVHAVSTVALFSCASVSEEEYQQSAHHLQNLFTFQLNRDGEAKDC